MEENRLESKELGEQAHPNYDNLFEFLDNPTPPTLDPAPTASNYFLKRQRPKVHYPYHCAHCDCKYLVEYAMKRHMRNTHDVKFYKCGTCYEAFSSKSQLQIHGLTHIPEKNYKCDICEKSFSYKKSQQRHTAMHRRNDDSTPCPVSGRQNVGNHLSNQPPSGIPNCHLCNKTFTTYGNAYRHMMKHYRACSSFECPQGGCQLKFEGFLELEAHLTKGHELDNRVCKKCGKSRRSWQSLVVHFHFGHFEEEKLVVNTSSASSKTSNQINGGFSISNILNSTISSPEPQFPTTSSASGQSSAAYNQLLFATMCAYPTFILPNLPSGSPSPSNSGTTTSSASPSECSEHGDNTTRTLSPDLQ
ncbi:unnamed protein product [Caenorhabditis brenneri]